MGQPTDNGAAVKGAGPSRAISCSPRECRMVVHGAAPEIAVHYEPNNMFAVLLFCLSKQTATTNDIAPKRPEAREGDAQM